MAASKTYENKQAAIWDCGHDYAIHKKSLRGKLICVYRAPANAEDRAMLTREQDGKIEFIEYDTNVWSAATAEVSPQEALALVQCACWNWSIYCSTGACHRRCIR